MLKVQQEKDSLEDIMQRVMGSLEEFVLLVRETHGFDELELIPIRSESTIKKIK